MISCVTCGLKYVTAKVGVGVETMAEFGPYQIFSADLFQCPGCGHEIVQVAKTPIAEHFQDGFAATRKSYSDRNRLFRSWDSIGAREAAK